MGAAASQDASRSFWDPGKMRFFGTKIIAAAAVEGTRHFPLLSPGDTSARGGIDRKWIVETILTR